MHDIIVFEISNKKFMWKGSLESSICELSMFKNMRAYCHTALNKSDADLFKVRSLATKHNYAMSPFKNLLAYPHFPICLNIRLKVLEPDSDVSQG